MRYSEKILRSENMFFIFVFVSKTTSAPPHVFSLVDGTLYGQHLRFRLHFQVTLTAALTCCQAAAEMYNNRKYYFHTFCDQEKVITTSTTYFD